MDGPVVGAVRVANVKGYCWDNCHWMDLSPEPYSKTFGLRSWNVPSGYYITQLDLDRSRVAANINGEYAGVYSPTVGAVRICKLTKDS